MTNSPSTCNIHPYVSLLRSSLSLPINYNLFIRNEKYQLSCIEWTDDGEELSSITHSILHSCTQILQYMYHLASTFCKQAINLWENRRCVLLLFSFEGIITPSIYFRFPVVKFIGCFSPLLCVILRHLWIYFLYTFNRFCISSHLW